MAQISPQEWDSSRVLYKYLDVDGAFLTLSNRTVRCTSPIEFNDPFDTTTEIRLGFEPEEFGSAIANHLKRLIFSDAPPVFEEMTPLAHAILAARKIRKRLRKDAPIDLEEQGLKAAFEDIRRTMDDGNRMWRDFLLTWRIYSLSERTDNLLMWAHYADMHRGAVVGFRCVPDLDSCFCVAEKVRYQREIPVLATLDEWLQHIVGQKRLNLEEKFMELTLTKSSDWEYEQEYRYMLPKIPESDLNYDIRRIDPQEIHTLHLGCRMTTTDRGKIISEIKGDLSHVQVYQALQSRTNFAIEFEPISVA